MARKKKTEDIIEQEVTIENILDQALDNEPKPIVLFDYVINFQWVDLAGHLSSIYSTDFQSLSRTLSINEAREILLQKYKGCQRLKERHKIVNIEVVLK